MDDVELEYVLPSADLQPYVTTFYRFRASDPMFEDVERAQIAQLRFRLLPGDACYRFADGSEQTAPPFHLLGPTTGPTRACVAGPVFIFGLGISPAGWEAMLGCDASALVNRVVDATTLFGPAVAEAGIFLRKDGGVAAMAAVVEPLLRRLLKGGGATTLAFCNAVDAWLSASASPAIEALIGVTGLSRRQVERRCNALYGVPPKLLARRYRALRAAVALASGDGAKESEEGFYDQSHLIREVKQFTGLTPRRLRTDPGALARLTIAHRRALDGVHPMVVET